MSAALVFGLLLQALSVAVMFLAFGRRTLLRAGPYFLLSAVVYHGLTEIVQAATGSGSKYRRYVTTASADRWVLIAGAACLLFALAYVATSRRRADDPPTPAVGEISRVFDWRILALLTVPLVLIVARGTYRYGDLTHVQGGTSTSAGFAAQFFDLAVTLTTVGFIAKHPRGFLPAVLVELAAVVLVGSRNDILVVFVCTLVGLALLGRRPRGRGVLAALLVAGFVIASINSTRQIYGRDAYNNASSLSSRLTLIGSGAAGLVEGRPAVYQGQSQPLGERIDGNSFPAGELDGMRNGVPTVGLATVRNDVALAVPSVLNPGKLSSDLAARSEKTYLNEHYEIGYPGDFIPTQLGTMLGYYGPLGLLVLAALFGAGYGWLDRRLLRVTSPARYLGVLALLICALSYPKSLDVYPVTVRGAVTVLLVLTVLDRLRPRVVQRIRSRRRPGTARRRAARRSPTAARAVVAARRS